MKSKKKFLLLGVGAMGALALGVGATSTFAWFTASETASVAGSKTTTATVSNVETIATTTIDVEFELVALQDPSKLQLTTYGTTNLKTGESKSAGYSYYAFDANGTLQESVQATGCVASTGYQLYVAQQSLSDAQKAALASSTFTLSIDALNSSGIVAWVSASANDVDDDDAPKTSGNPATIVTSLASIAMPSLTNIGTAHAECAAYVGIYADGGAANNNEGSGASKTVTLAVTIS